MVTTRTTAARATEQTLSRVYNAVEIVRQAVLDASAAVVYSAENLTADVVFPNNYPDAETHSLLTSLRNDVNTGIEVNNLPAVQTIIGDVEVTNFPTSTEVTNFPSSFEVSNFPASFEVSVTNLPQVQEVSGTVAVSNQPTNFPDSDGLAQLQAANTKLQQLITLLTDDAKTELKDYGNRLDDKPVYEGTAPQGASQSAPSWTIIRHTYDTNGRRTVSQEVRGAIWDDRASAGWANY